jgi:hypothetical protein
MSTVLQRRGFLASIAAVVASPLVAFAAPVKPEQRRHITLRQGPWAGGRFMYADEMASLMVDGEPIEKGHIPILMPDGRIMLWGHTNPTKFAQHATSTARNRP